MEGTLVLHFSLRSHQRPRIPSVTTFFVTMLCLCSCWPLFLTPLTLLDHSALPHPSSPSSTSTFCDSLYLNSHSQTTNGFILSGPGTPPGMFPLVHEPLESWGYISIFCPLCLAPHFLVHSCAPKYGSRERRKWHLAKG